jgi:serine/threonine-protein kinase
MSQTFDFDATRTIGAEPDGPEPDQPTAFGVTVAEPNRRFVLGPLIGTGGMGEVREAEQQVLARRVAVKGLPERVRSRRAVRRLLQEAWITGALEHPNIIPIHDIDYDDGAPRIVMKHVEGRVWTELMDDPGAAGLEVDDPLEWNLGVLEAVCNAVQFAHSRGVLHRDLKPDNVMVGAYGEVYVLDWGIAVSLHPRPDGRVPLASEVTRAAGTPAYMAPEMLVGDGAQLGPHTDVYLLGALLYRVVSGHPLRQGAGLDEVLDAVANDDPPIDPEWPIAALLTAALSRDPARRPTVEGFREGLRTWVRNRDARRLKAAGADEIDALCAAIARRAPRRALHDRFSAARFALAEAQRRWPEIPGIDAIRDRGAIALATYELEDGDPGAADLVIQHAADAPESLRNAIASRLAEQRGAAAELQRIRADNDPRTALLQRAGFAGSIAACWVVVPLGSVLLGIPSGYAREWFVSGGILAVTILLLGGLWPWLLRSRMNRSVLLMLVTMPAFALLFLTGAWLAGLDAVTAAALEMIVYVMMLVLATGLVDWRLAPSVPLYVGCFLLSAWAPEYSLTLLGLGNIVIGLNVGAVLIRPLFSRR